MLADFPHKRIPVLNGARWWYFRENKTNTESNNHTNLDAVVQYRKRGHNVAPVCFVLYSHHRYRKRKLHADKSGGSKLTMRTRQTTSAERTVDRVETGIARMCVCVCVSLTFRSPTTRLIGTPNTSVSKARWYDTILYKYIYI